MTPSNELDHLAARADMVSRDLHKFQDDCCHGETSEDIANVANELALLSTTLWRLHEAMNSNGDQYTTAFAQDLDEIKTELLLVLDEITECCKEMQKLDGREHSTIGWFFKKGRVTKLHRHLTALKTTLIVMRTVLYHGKEYGVQNSPGRLAESSPHTMSEDRVILESVFAKNRNAIVDLHNIDHAHSRDKSSSTTSQNDVIFEPGAHGRKLSIATGIEIPTEHDILPSTYNGSHHTSGINRRFSKRGVRLGVHASILDLGAHDAPIGLKRRWLHEARQQGGLPKQKELSDISEDEADRAMLAVKPAPLVSEPKTEPLHPNSVLDSPVKKKAQVPSRLAELPLGNSFRKIVRKLSFIRTESNSSGKDCSNKPVKKDVDENVQVL